MLFQPYTIQAGLVFFFVFLSSSVEKQGITYFLRKLPGYEQWHIAF